MSKLIDYLAIGGSFLVGFNTTLNWLEGSPATFFTWLFAVLLSVHIAIQSILRILPDDLETEHDR